MLFVPARQIAHTRHGDRTHNICLLLLLSSFDCKVLRESSPMKWRVASASNFSFEPSASLFNTHTYICFERREWVESALQFGVPIHIVKVTKFVRRRTNFPLIVPFAHVNTHYISPGPLKRHDDERRVEIKYMVPSSQTWQYLFETCNGISATYKRPLQLTPSFILFLSVVCTLARIGYNCKHLL